MNYIIVTKIMIMIMITIMVMTVKGANLLTEPRTVSNSLTDEGGEKNGVPAEKP